MQTAPALPFNILLDPLPGDYEGYLIRTDYRIGIQISLCLQDEDLTQDERITQAVYLLFGNGMPPLEIALNGLAWFINCGQPKREDVSTTVGEQKFWFDFDHARIMSSFRKTYGVKVHKESLHWFEFMAMLDSLDEDSALSHAIQLRGTDTANMKGKQRREFDRAKKLITPPRTYSDEERDRIDAFFSGD